MLIFIALKLNGEVATKTFEKITALEVQSLRKTKKTK